MKSHTKLMMLGFLSLSLASIGFLFAPCGKEVLAASPAPEQKVIELKFGCDYPPTHARYVGYNLPWFDMLAGATGGRIKIKPYPANALGKEAQAYNTLTTGIADMYEETARLVPGVFPLSVIPESPGLMGTHSGLDYGRAIWEIYEKGIVPKFKEEYKDFKLLYLFAIVQGTIWTKQPVHSLADFKGKKLRAPVGATSLAVRALGGIPVDVPWSEVYDAMSKGVIDGGCSDWQGPVSTRWYEVAKYCVQTDFGASITWGGMNWDSYKKLPQEIQKEIDKYSDKWATDYYCRGAMNILAESKLVALKNGVKLYDLPPDEGARWTERLKPIADQAGKDLDAKGLPGTEMVKAIRQLLAR